jgi:hypothetical protein
MHHDHDEHMREYARRTADELLKNLHSRPTEEQTPITVDCGVMETPHEQ